MRKDLVLAALFMTQVPAAPLIAQAPAPPTITVELSNLRFSPNELTLEHGRPFRLHLVNAAGGAHDFSAPEFFAASTIVPEDRGKVADGKVKLAGKETVDITLTPQKAGAYVLRCTHFLHAGMGMNGRIVVQ